MRPRGRACFAVLAIALGALALGRPAGVREPATHGSFSLTFDVARAMAFAKSLSTPEGSQNSFPAVLKLLYENASGSTPKAGRLTAFEENESFIYALGTAAQSSLASAPAGEQLLRRVVVLRPSIMVIDDELAGASADADVRWRILMPNRPSIAGLRAEAMTGGAAISLQTLLPNPAQYRMANPPGGPAAGAPYALEVVTAGQAAPTRLLTVFRIGAKDRGRAPLHSELMRREGEWDLTITAADRVFRLDLPAPSAGAGEIAISAPGGQTLLAARPLPSGVLPHGPEGSRLLELWDSDYRGKQPPIWDIGHPADELRRVVGSGKIRACRALDLCCGSGSDALYLASRKFDVTAIDVSPTAIAQAQEKARRAGAAVHWVLADVLAPPDLQPFDFIYDRGCYHVVRDQNLTAYLDTVRRFSRRGTQFLLLASRRGERRGEGDSAGVTEEELNFDFSPLFNMEWLRPYRLESTVGGGSGPPAWSALMIRKAEP